MAKRAIIPITDHNAPGVCTSFYAIRLKQTSDMNFTQLSNQYGTLYGSPAEYCIILDNLDDGIEYTLEVTRYCCEGTNSAPVTIDFFANDTP